MSSFQWPPLGGSGTSGIQTYPTFASFPSSPNNGDQAIALDTDNVYIWNSGSSSWVLVASPTDLIDTLTSAHIFVGNASNVATDRAMSGDVSITNLGATTVLTVGAATAANIAIASSSIATINAFTAGSIPYASGTGLIQDNTNFFWATSTHRLGLATASPSVTLDVNGSARVRGLTTAGPVSTDVSGNLTSAAAGTLSDAGTDGIIVTGGSGCLLTSASFAQHVADATHNGYLSSTDWSTFNGKGAGSVTSVTFTGDGTILSATPSSAVTTSGTLTAAAAAYTTPNKVVATAVSGSVSTALAVRSLVGADLPNPGASSLGGVQSAAAVTNQWINSISTAGVPALSQPAFSNISGTIAAAQVTNGITGTTTNNSAATGIVGEYIVATRSSGSAITSGGTGNYGDVTSISLTAGDWDVTGVVAYGGGTAVQYVAAGISVTTGNSATGLDEGDTLTYSAAPTATNDAVPVVPDVRILIASTTTVYLKYRTGFTTTSPNIFGRISARRRR